jgi:hypothetical protein
VVQTIIPVNDTYFHRSIIAPDKEIILEGRFTISQVRNTAVPSTANDKHLESSRVTASTACVTILTRSAKFKF